MKTSTSLPQSRNSIGTGARQEQVRCHSEHIHAIIVNRYCWEGKNQVSFLWLSVQLLCLRCIWLPFMKAFSFSFSLFHLDEQDSKFFNHFTTAQFDVLTQQAKKPNLTLADYTHLKLSNQKYLILEIICSANCILLRFESSKKKNEKILIRWLQPYLYEGEEKINWSFLKAYYLAHSRHRQKLHLYLKQHANKFFAIYLEQMNMHKSNL